MSDRFRVMRLDEVEGTPRRAAAVAHPLDARDRVVRHQRVASDRGGSGDHRQHDELGPCRRARGFTCPRRTGDVHARRRRWRPAAHSFSSGSRHEAERGRERGRDRDPRRRRQARGPLRLWERSAEALRFWTTGEWDRAIDILRAQLAQDPHNANLFYNLACAESRGGHGDSALDHLHRAIELEPKFAQLAIEDDDLDAIRADPRFPS
jgi:tetratricopeptide (TPR) repeat protein